MTLRKWLLALLALLPCSALQAQPGFELPGQSQGPLALPIEFKGAVSPTVVPRGGRVTVTITGLPEPGYHTYPITQRTPGWTGTDSLSFDKSIPWAKPLWPTLEETAPSKEKQSDGSTLWVLEGEFTWKLQVFIAKDAPEGKQKLKIRIHGQVCNLQGCTPFPRSMGVEPEIEVRGDTPGQPDEATTKLLAATGPVDRQVPIDSPAPPPKKEPAPAPTKETTTPTVPQKAGVAPAAEQEGLVGFLLLSAGAAVLMLLTPCVFPMIPITVSLFLKRAEKEHNRPLVSALVYSLTIIAMLSAAVFFLGQVIITLANNPWLNLGLGAVLIFFALSLFGMYEIELPSGLTRFTAARQGTEGYLGVVFMALTFTVTSFTCTGPFLGPLLAGIQVLGVNQTWLILGAVVYSATFAFPFFLLALFPTLLKRLPKSGGWLNGVKVVMGFLELAAALKFLGNTDLTLNPGNPMFFSYDTVLCAWIGLSIGCALYLFGVFRLPHDTPVESLGVPRMLLAAGFLGLAIYMAPALWRETPQGIIGRGLVAFLPLDTRPNDKELTWTFDYEAAWKQAAEENKPIFIDFTGVNCTNCRANEKNVFVLPEVRKELEKYVRVRLYTDSVPDPNLSKTAAQEQAERNQEWQGNTFRDLTNPFYAIVRPHKGEPAIIQGANGAPVLNGVNPSWTRKALINNVADFQDFLATGVSAQAPQRLASR